MCMVSATRGRYARCWDVRTVESEKLLESGMSPLESKNENYKWIQDWEVMGTTNVNQNVTQWEHKTRPNGSQEWEHQTSAKWIKKDLNKTRQPSRHVPLAVPFQAIIINSSSFGFSAKTCWNLIILSWGSRRDDKLPSAACRPDEAICNALRRRKVFAGRKQILWNWFSSTLVDAHFPFCFRLKMHFSCYFNHLRAAQLLRNASQARNQSWCWDSVLVIFHLLLHLLNIYTRRARRHPDIETTRELLENFTA